MRHTHLLALTLLCSAPALAWVPKLEDVTAKNVIDGAYGRRDPLPTFLTLDLTVKDGAFVAGQTAVRVFEGGDACLSGWLAAPQDFAGGSRPVGITVSGQADQLFFAAQDARDHFKNLSVKDALAAFAAGVLPSDANGFGSALPAPAGAPATTTLGSTTPAATTPATTTPATATPAPASPAALQTPALADGDLRIDVSVRGLPSERARSAYLLRLKGPDGKLIPPIRTSYVNDFKQDAGSWSGTLVFYFQPLRAGIGASDKAELLLRTEADTPCAYTVPLDLSTFQ